MTKNISDEHVASVRCWETREASDEKIPRRNVWLETSDPTSIFEDSAQKVRAYNHFGVSGPKACFTSAAMMISFEEKTAFQIDKYIVKIDGRVAAWSSGFFHFILIRIYRSSPARGDSCLSLPKNFSYLCERFRGCRVEAG